MELNDLIEKLTRARDEQAYNVGGRMRVGVVASNVDDFEWIEADVSSVQVLLPYTVIHCRVTREQEQALFQRQDEYEPPEPPEAPEPTEEQLAVWRQQAGVMAENIEERAFAPALFPQLLRVNTPEEQALRQMHQAIYAQQVGSLRWHAKKLFLKYWQDFAADRSGEAELGLEWERAALLGLVLTPTFPEATYQFENACQSILGHQPVLDKEAAAVFRTARALEKS